MGGMPSIPALPGQRRRAFGAAHSFWVADRLVAVLAHADEVALLLSIGVFVINIQRQRRSIPHMVYMVYQLGAVIPPALLAYLALVPVHLQHLP